MILKIRMLRLVIKIARSSLAIADSIDGMKLSFQNAVTVVTKINWRRWCKWVVRAAAVGATVTGAVTAASTASTTTGIAIGAAGATGTYATTKGVSTKGYERIKHVSPKTSQRSSTVNMHHKPVAHNKRTTVQKPTVQKRS
jgi:hypothetical protein